MHGYLRFSRLPEASDAWKPEFAEVTGSVSRASEFAVAAAASSGERNGRTASTEATVAQAMA